VPYRQARPNESRSAHRLTSPDPARRPSSGTPRWRRSRWLERPPCDQRTTFNVRQQSTVADDPIPLSPACPSLTNSSRRRQDQLPQVVSGQRGVRPPVPAAALAARSVAFVAQSRGQQGRPAAPSRSTGEELKLSEVHRSGTGSQSVSQGEAPVRPVGARRPWMGRTGTACRRCASRRASSGPAPVRRRRATGGRRCAGSGAGARRRRRPVPRGHG